MIYEKYLTQNQHRLPETAYKVPVRYTGEMIKERNAEVVMRDGVRLYVDIYRPDTKDKLPALLSFGPHNKDFMAPELTEECGAQPAWSSVWSGNAETGDNRYLTSRGYVHVISNFRSSGGNDDGKPSPFDGYDLIEWMAEQPWCDGNIGMIGLSAYAQFQWNVAITKPPHLKAIAPLDAGNLYDFADYHTGGMLCLMRTCVRQASIAHHNQGKPGKLPDEMEKYWEKAMANKDYQMYPYVYNIISQKGQINPGMFQELIYPFAPENEIEKGKEKAAKITIPALTGSGWHAHSYVGHLAGCQSWYQNINVPKKMIIGGLAHFERPFHELHNEILSWYDYWLRGIDTGIMEAPNVRYWIHGANCWGKADNWPVPETQWTKLYLQSWERLTPEAHDHYSEREDTQPDLFAQMPPTKTRKEQRLRYMTEPLPENILVAGPISLTLYAAIDQEDTNWIVSLKDVGPDYSIRSARKGEEFIPEDLPEHELTRGWLKASYRAVDEKHSVPYRPIHICTPETVKPVKPGEIVEYKIEIQATANLFEKGHRICLDIMSMDFPTGTGLFDVEYIAYHVCSSKNTVHKIYHDEEHPSHLLLPFVPYKKEEEKSQDAGK